MQNQKGFVPVIIILVVLIGFVGVYFLGTLKNKPSDVSSTASPTAVAKESTVPTSKPVTTIDPTSNWKIINGKHWSFKVPEGWYYIKCLSGNDMILGPNLSKEFRDIDSECNFGISDFLNVSRVTEKFSIPITSSPDQNGIYTIVSNKKNILIDKQNAVEQTEEIHGNPSEGTHTAIYVEHSGYTDMLTFWNSNTNTKKETIDQILSTFKFTN